MDAASLLYRYKAKLMIHRANPPYNTMAPTALAIRRITIDTKKALELTDQGLFWIPNESDITHGWAIVCGCEDTPYHGGAFCFEVRFPDNYPFEPPTFTYLTNDGRTRFNPNLYKNGKVCLSLLNTWAGEPWSGIQSLSSILQCIQTAVLNEEPLVNEPSHPASKDRTHPDLPAYSRMIQHATVETAILGLLGEPADYVVPVYDALRVWILKARPAVIARLRALATVWDGKTETMGFYSMGVRYRFGELADKIYIL
jgi:ubiquitin-protein ligase